jgi:hypothetical protein
MKKRLDIKKVSIMLTIDEYIAKMKRADKIDEFDYSKKPENMSAVMKYVMAYFNEYLNIETCDTETIKFKHATDKLEEEAEKKAGRILAGRED